MRILAIGLGGAGGRIVDMLYRTDRRSAKVECVQALAVDVDTDSLSQLTGLPEASKIDFPPMDISNPQDPVDAGLTATIDVAEVTARVHTMTTGETDAIVFCAGLGGGVVDAAPRIIAALRASMIEPIFGIVTLPCLAEGERCSAKAADDIETLSPLLDGVIIFDNETWYKKIKSQKKALVREDRSFATRFGLKKKPDKTVSPVHRMYALLNEAIVRRVSLMLRAGEFKADGGIELAEVVLDAGEVLNTMRGMGFITIGYAVEQLPQHPLNFLKKWRPTGFFADEHQKKASRIVELAKQAIYHDISAPCDLTSAQKALILVAGPSHELSMKGYMTVRKWIDRSIAGLETRSGDYPVTSTRFVAIIIMLTGLKNIPRIEELKEIRAQYREHLAGEKIPHDEIIRKEEVPLQEGIAEPYGSAQQPSILRDQMISLPKKKHMKLNEGAGKGRGDLPYSSTNTGLHTRDTPATGMQEKPDESFKASTETDHPRRHIIVSKPHVPKQQQKEVQTTEKETPIPIKKILASSSLRPPFDKSLVSLDDRNKIKEQERKKIERELQKQRLMAMTGKDPNFDRNFHKRPVTGSQSQSSHQDTPYGTKREESDQVPVTQSEVHKKPEIKQEMQKIVLHKRRSQTDHIPSPTRPHVADTVPESKISEKDRESGIKSGQEGTDEDTIDDWIKRVSPPKKDQIFERESFKLKDESPAVSDEALLHTNLTRARAFTESRDFIKDIEVSESQGETDAVSKKPRKKRTDEDITWVD